MSGQWDSDAERAISIGDPDASPSDAPSSGTGLSVGMGPSPASEPPDVPPPPPGPDHAPAVEGRAGRARRSIGMGIVAGGLALTVLIAFGIATIVNSRESGIRAAFASVFSGPTLKVVFTGHSSNRAQEAVAGRYSVAFTMTDNGGAPLSASGGRRDYQVSVLRAGADLADVIIVHNSIYVRLDLRSIKRGSYESALRSLAATRPGPAHDVASSLVHDQWVGISEATMESLVKTFDPKAPPRPAGARLGKLSHAFTLSFAQSWDAWTSIHRLSSRNGVTKYSVKLPVQHFVSMLLSDIKGAVSRDLPGADLRIARAELRAAASAVDRVPAGFEIPMILSVANGSLSNVVITHKGSSISLAISHPAVGLTAPLAPAMVTEPMVRSWLGGSVHSSSSGFRSSSGSGSTSASSSSIIKVG